MLNITADTPCTGANIPQPNIAIDTVAIAT